MAEEYKEIPENQPVAAFEIGIGAGRGGGRNHRHVGLSGRIGVELRRGLGRGRNLVMSTWAEWRAARRLSLRQNRQRRSKECKAPQIEVHVFDLFTNERLLRLHMGMTMTQRLERETVSESITGRLARLFPLRRYILKGCRSCRQGQRPENPGPKQYHEHADNCRTPARWGHSRSARRHNAF